MTVTTENAKVAEYLQRVEELGEWCPPRLAEEIRASIVAVAFRDRVTAQTDAARAKLEGILAGMPDDLTQAVRAAAKVVEAERLEAALTVPEVTAEAQNLALDAAQVRLLRPGGGDDLVVREPLYPRLVREWKAQGGNGLPPVALPEDLRAAQRFDELTYEVGRWTDNVTAWRQDRGIGDTVALLASAKSLGERADRLREEISAYTGMCSAALKARRDAGLPTSPQFAGRL